MDPVRRLLIGALVIATGAIGYAGGRAIFRPAERIVQPVAFSHQKHVGELEIECDLCHEFNAVGTHAGLPALSTCMGCHEEAQTDSPEEGTIRTLAAAGEEDVFRKLFRLSDHAFYTHRRHVTSAGLPCETCHGAIASTTAPPERPLKRITMEFCVDCHDRSGVSSDCTRCHR
jgi:hypothetical protein